MAHTHFYMRPPSPLRNLRVILRQSRARTVSPPCRFALLIGLLLAALVPIGSAADSDAFAFNRRLGRGMNLISDVLDPPTGVPLTDDDYRKIKDAGFDSVRIPIRWSIHAQPDAPYKIDPAFFLEVDRTIDQALSRNLSVVINVHHYLEMDADPTGQAPRLLSIWGQIADRYRLRPETLFFELFNEPNDDFTDERWNEVLSDLLWVIRKNNPKRMVIVGPAYWNDPDHLPQLRLPQNDRRLIATVHYYKPFQFTHQGANWIPESFMWNGTNWGTDQERDDIRVDFEKVALWARQNERPIYLGEFGAYEQAGMKSRALWTRTVAREAEKRGFSWAYWEFCAKFGAFDPVHRNWRQPLLQALQDK